jgi:hypothetical protein
MRPVTVWPPKPRVSTMSLSHCRPVNLFALTIALVGASSLLTGCPSAGTPTEGSAVMAAAEQTPVEATGQAAAPAPADGSGTGSGPSAMPPATECVLTQAEELIENIRLRSADGACSALVPFGVGVGELPVRASASADSVSIEADGGFGTLFATDGTFTITQSEGGRLVGTFSAEDQSPPAVGRLTGSFDVTLTPAAP